LGEVGQADFFPDFLIALLSPLPSFRSCIQAATSPGILEIRRKEEPVGYPRRQQVDPLVSGVYHCISRCVRQQSLIESAERCEWVVRRLERLTRTFAIDVCDFAVMRNHVHLLLRTQPELAMAWSDAEVARRWLARPGRVARGDTEDVLRAAVEDPGRIAEWRSRLSDLGWFHKLWKEPCSRMWNREEEQSGHLWQGRYRSIGCRDEASVLMQAAYILLNPVHCGAENELCDSPRTSMGRRLSALAEAISAGSCRRGVEAYRRVLLDPALPCDPGSDVCSLSDEEWSGRIAKRIHERALREEAFRRERVRPLLVERSGLRVPIEAERASQALQRKPAGHEDVDPRIGPSGGGVDSLEGAGDRGRRFAEPSSPKEFPTPRFTSMRPRTGPPRRANPWRLRATMAMAHLCSLVTFIEWTDQRGRIRRPDKPGRIDPGRPRVVERLRSRDGPRYAHAGSSRGVGSARNQARRGSACGPVRPGPERQ
jgi:hypothetical protein